MEIRFKLFGLTDILGENEASISIARGSSLREALDELVDTFGDALRERLLRSNGQLHDHIRLVMDGRIIDRLDERVEGDTTIFILHEIAGGS